MSSENQLATEGASIVVTPDHMQAILRIGHATDPQSLSIESLTAQANDVGIAMGDDTVALLTDALEQFNRDRRDIKVVIAQGIEPQHGTPGSIEWREGFDPATLKTDKADEEASEDAAPPQDDEDEDDAIDFYNQSTYLTIEEGQQIATLIKPESGMPGFDVYGRRIPPKPGKTYPLQAHPTVRVEADGTISAAIAGLLTLDATHIRVDPILQVPGGVNFASGNIEFNGTVLIGNGVCDRFTVECTDELTVSGLIEAAHLKCGGNFRAGGFAGREQGTLTVGGDAKCRYLVGVKAQIAGDLVVEKEIINSRVNVNGSLSIRSGDLIGSEAHVQNRVKIATIGSEAGVPTTLRMGYVPEVTEPLNQIEEVLPRIIENIEELNGRIDELDGPTDQHPEAIAMKRKELTNARDQLQGKLDLLRMRFDTLIEQFNGQSRVSMEVYNAIHPGVKLVLPCHTIEFYETLQGPLTLYRANDGRIHVHNASGDDLQLPETARVTHTRKW